MRKGFSSLRSRQRDASVDATDRPGQQHYDFRYPVRVQIERPISKRPNTADGISSLSKTLLEERPQPAETSLINRRLQAAKTENKLIGVAIGSPTHVPTGWVKDPSPISPQHAFRIEGPLPARASPDQKDGGDSPVIKQEIKHPLSIRHSPSNLSHTEPVSPISNTADGGRADTTAPVSPISIPVDGRRGDTNAPSPWISAESLLPSQTSKNAPNPVSTTTRVQGSNRAPSLDLPKFDLDLSTAVGGAFNDITKSKDPETISKRAKAIIEKRRAASRTRQAEPANNSKSWPTRIASLQPSERSASRLGLASKTAVPAADDGDDGSDSDSSVEGIIQQYHSLSYTSADDFRFADARNETKKPQAASGLKIMDRTRFSPRQQTSLSRGDKPRSQLSRELPRPEENANYIAHHQRSQTDESSKTKPLHKPHPPLVQYLSSPEREKADEKDKPWRSSGSLQSTPSSQTSVEEDIFFDLKPYKDANGVRASQYVVTNPDAVAVQLARTMSQKNRLKQQGNGASVDGKSYKWTPEMLSNPWSLPPDVQAAEHFCISSDSQAVEPVLRMSMFDKAIQDVERLASASARDKPKIERRIKARRAAARAKHVRIPSRSKGFDIGIPSPITERSRESTPRETPLPEESRLIPPIPNQGTKQSRLDPAIIVATLSSTFEIPPPVPEKDSKFLSVKTEGTKPTTQKPNKAANRVSKNYSHQSSSNSARRRSRSRRDLLLARGPYDSRLMGPRSPVPKIPPELRSASPRTASPRIASPRIPPDARSAFPRPPGARSPEEARSPVLRRPGPGPPHDPRPQVSRPPGPGMPVDARLPQSRPPGSGMPPDSRSPISRPPGSGMPADARLHFPRPPGQGMAYDARPPPSRRPGSRTSYEAASSPPKSAAPRVPGEWKTFPPRSASPRMPYDSRSPFPRINAPGSVDLRPASPRNPYETRSPISKSNVPRSNNPGLTELKTSSPRPSASTEEYSPEIGPEQISVARKVSLTRKSSHRITVKGSGSLQPQPEVAAS